MKIQTLYYIILLISLLSPMIVYEITKSNIAIYWLTTCFLGTCLDILIVVFIKMKETVYNYQNSDAI